MGLAKTIDLPIGQQIRRRSVCHPGHNPGQRAPSGWSRIGARIKTLIGSGAIEAVGR